MQYCNVITNTYIQIPFCQDSMVRLTIRIWRWWTRNWVGKIKYVAKGRLFSCETQPPASIGWVALSSMFVCSLFVPHPLHLLSSPLYDVSDHTNQIFSVRIWSWQHVNVIHCWVEPSLLLSSFWTILRTCCYAVVSHSHPQPNPSWRREFYMMPN